MAPINFEVAVLLLFGGVELAVNTVGVPVSALNLFLVWRTPLLHPNLKCILLYQSACLALRGASRIAYNLLEFVTADPMGALVGVYSGPYLSMAYNIGIYSRNFVVHVLIIERCMATVLVSRYEQHWRNWKFTLVWAPIVTVGGLYNAVASMQSVAALSPVNLCTTIGLFLLGMLELAIFVGLWRWNRDVYVRSLGKQVHTLSERYQLSENIRIGRQLAPALVLNLFNIFTGMVLLCAAFFGAPGMSYIFGSIGLLNSLCGVLIEISMITCHPFLKRDLRAILRRFMKLVGIHSQRVGVAGAVDSQSAIGLRDMIHGRNLIEKPLPESHYSMLRTAWN